MTAQHQLAELMRQGVSPAQFRDAVSFLRDHGPAIAELIDHAEVLKDCRSIHETLITVELIKAALRKLTQD